jgi:acyl-CoA reductase-like NAD-dependent aldehyde dehydrogenase
MTRFPLQDPDLFRRQAYIAGHWCDAANGATLEVNNPATGAILGTVPNMGATETRRGKKRLARLASQACQIPERSRA